VKPRPIRHSLILRLVGISLLLLLIVQAAGFAVVNRGIDRNARGQIARELDTDERVWHRLLEQNAERLRQGSALLAADYGFRSAVSSGDQETIQSALENHGNRIGAAATALLDTQLVLRAVSLAGGMQHMPESLAQVVQALVAQPQGSQVAVMDGRPYQFVMVPLKAPAQVIIDRRIWPGPSLVTRRKRVFGENLAGSTVMGGPRFATGGRSTGSLSTLAAGTLTTADADSPSGSVMV